MSQKHVLAVLQTPTYGGPHNTVLRLYKPLLQLGWEMIALLPEEPGNAYERLSAHGITVLTVPLHRLRATWNAYTHIQLVTGLIPEINAIQQILCDYRIDLVNVCGLLNVQGAIAAHRENVPLCWQLLSTFAPYPLRLALSPLVTQLSDSIMSTGLKVAQDHPGLMKAKDKLVPFYSPVDTSTFCPRPVAREKARAELGIADDTVLIGTVGNFSRQKGHDYLVEVASILRSDHTNLAFRILGTDTFSNAVYYKKNVKQKAETLGVTQNGYLQFNNPGNRVADLLPGFDIFVLTSRAEGVPTVALEAMSCGVPVVSTNVGGIAEIVENGKTGILVKDSTPQGIAEALRKLISAPDERRQMGITARERAVTYYDVEVCAKAHSYAYEMAIKNHYARARPIQHASHV